MLKRIGTIVVVLGCVGLIFWFLWAIGYTRANADDLANTWTVGTMAGLLAKPREAHDLAQAAGLVRDALWSGAILVVVAVVLGLRSWPRYVYWLCGGLCLVTLPTIFIGVTTLPWFVLSGAIVGLGHVDPETVSEGHFMRASVAIVAIGVVLLALHVRFDQSAPRGVSRASS